MSFVITYLIVFAILLTTGLLTVRRFFVTTTAGGYVFVAINWFFLAVISAFAVLLLEYLVALFVG